MTAVSQVRRGVARKAVVVQRIGERMGRSRAVILTDFRGLNVAAMTRLRRRLRETGAEYMVAKNTLIRRAAQGMAADGALAGFLEGPTGLCFVYEDPTAVVKALADFAREFPNLKVKGGWMAGRVLGPQEVELLGQLPPREVLLARVLGGLQAPIFGLVWVLQGTVRQLVQVLDAIRVKKAAEQEGGRTAA